MYSKGDRFESPSVLKFLGIFLNHSRPMRGSEVGEVFVASCSNV